MKKKLLLITVLLFTLTINVQAEGWIEKNGNKYYENSDGTIATGFIEIDGRYYFLSRDKTKLGAMRTGMLTIGDYSYYLNDSAQTGWFEYNGNEYYANEKGEIQHGITNIDGKNYLLSNDRTKFGAKRTGMITVGDKVYYFNPYAQTGWFKYNGNEYYANEQGEIQHGVVNIDGKIYLLSNDKTKLGAKRTGMITVGDKIYYFKPNAQIGWFEYHSNEYYANEKGEIQVGFQTINDKIYFFTRDKTKYGAKKTGMFMVGDTMYYLNPYAQTGWINYNGNEYYANEKGEFQLGFTNIEGKTYFFSREKSKYATKKTGMFFVGDKLYFFNPYAQTGWINYGGKKYYANEKGEMLRGFQTIDNEIYFFSNAKGQEGVMRTGWITFNDNYYYFNKEGKALRGVQTVDGRSYKFNETTGMVEGFKKENGKLHYYNPDGTKAKGIQYMMNKFWKFNEISGDFEKYVREVRVIDVSSHQGKINWEMVKASGKVDGVILRLGYGIGYVDTYFLINKNELERLGIPYSVYLFSYAENKDEALKESNFLVKTIKDNGVKIASHIFPIYYDLEDWYIKSTGENSNNISKDTYKNMIVTFINNTERNLCIKTRVYASKNFIETRFPSDVQHYATWVAQWSNALTYKGPYEGWQFTDCASVPGISGCVDMSKFYY